MSATAISQFKQIFITPESPWLGSEVRAGVLGETELNQKLDEFFLQSRITPHRQRLIRALLLLWHDHLDASHTISQGIENADGSFLHAMMHRREPDYSNAKYWWRRVGAHPAFIGIAQRVGELLARRRQREEADLAKRLLPGSKWDACAFVDLCEAAAGSGQHIDLCREIQRIETEVLLNQLLTKDG